MVSSTSIININGNRYDAKTGKLMPDNPTPKKPSTPMSQGLVMDGVMRRGARVTKNLSPQPIASSPSHATVKAPKPAKSMHHKAHRSKTLNRHAVLRPTVGPKIHTHSKSMSEIKPAPKSFNGFVSAPSAERSARAEGINRSLMIQKFRPFSSKKSADKNSTVLQGEVLAGSSVKPAKTDPKNLPPILPSTISSATHGNIDQLVDRALHTASSHKQKSPKKRHFIKRMPKLVSACAVLLVVFILGGFFAYQYIPNVAVRVASSQAGISADLPGYQPSGFAFNGVASSPGTVVISYSANGDGQRQFKLMQKGSNWDSESLLSNYVSQESKNYQTFNENGKTIYMYGSDSATWVSRGIWYVVEGGTAELNSDQLLKIASSI